MKGYVLAYIVPDTITETASACHDVRRCHDACGGSGTGGNDERPLPPGPEEDEGMILNIPSWQQKISKPE